MSAPHPLPDPLVELIAQRFRVIGEPMRIKLLDRLRGGRGVGRRADPDALGATQQNVSRHLAVSACGPASSRGASRAPAPSTHRRPDRVRALRDRCAERCSTRSPSSRCCSTQRSSRSRGRIVSIASRSRAAEPSLERVLFALAGTVVLIGARSRRSSAPGSCC